MKIIFVASHLTIFVGGGKFLMDYANKFSELGHNVTVVAQRIDSHNYKFNKAVDIIEIGGHLPSNPLYWFSFNSIKNKYLQILNELRSDVLLSFNFPINYFCANADRQKHQKYIYFCLEPLRFFHDKKFYSETTFLRRNASRLLKLLYRKYDIESVRSADEIICISEFVKKRVQNIYGRGSLVHHIGIDTDSEIDSNCNLDQEIFIKKGNSAVIFALGLSHQLKGAKELIIIFNKILNDITNAVLVVGGWIPKENEKKMKGLIKKLKIPQEKIRFYGFIDDAKLDYFYKNSTLTLYTAIDEAYGYIPIESMRNGTPVVAFEGGPSDTIIDGQTGYIIKNYDIDSFAQKAIMLLHDKGLREKYSINSRQHVKNNFNINKNCSKLESTLQNIISPN